MSFFATERGLVVLYVIAIAGWSAVALAVVVTVSERRRLK